jgi:hypothetical protein
MKWLKRWKTRTLLAVIGPGFSTANVDRHAEGIRTHSFARTHSGHILLLKILLLTTLDRHDFSDGVRPGFFPAAGES